MEGKRIQDWAGWVSWEEWRGYVDMEGGGKGRTLEEDIKTEIRGRRREVKLSIKLVK